MVLFYISGKRHPLAHCQRYPHLPAFPIFAQYLLHQYWAEPLSVLLSDRQFIYPALLTPDTPPPSLVFSDQFAFRPSGSTTAAVIAILQTVTNLLSDHPYVIVISLYFSKAFDTVCHTTLLQKFAQLDIPDAVYNWLVDYFASHSHCTKYGGSTSSLCQMSANIVQGSKSPDPDGIHPRILKELATELAVLLRKIFQCSIYSRHIPLSWKLAYIVPIFYNK